MNVTSLQRDAVYQSSDSRCDEGSCAIRVGDAKRLWTIDAGRDDEQRET